MEKISKVACIKDVVGSDGKVKYHQGQLYDTYVSRLGWRVVVPNPAIEPISENSSYFDTDFFNDKFKLV